MMALIGIEVFCRNTGLVGSCASSYVGLRNGEPKLRTYLI
ncbi:hypothetical protein CEB3_c21690 [Peptococcaceae bacterium CEB3]|nr:hypothetical protein CEB3_c21690 [Peptococcaceae bacterium CEB3]